MLRGMIADYPGVVVIATDRPASLLTHWTTWSPRGEGVERGQGLPREQSVPRGELGTVIDLHG